MKTIEERAREIAIEQGKDFCVEDFILGAQSEHEELTRWHDPKVALTPKDINSGGVYLLKIMDDDGEIGYRVGSRIPNSKAFLFPSFSIASTVIGWREIHE